jgi:hypothetical protein
MKILILILESDLAIAAPAKSATEKNPVRCTPPRIQSAKDNAPLNIRACLVPAMPASTAYSVRTVLSQVSGQT